jgi:hypothetical protein
LALIQHGFIDCYYETHDHRNPNNLKVFGKKYAVYRIIDLVYKVDLYWFNLQVVCVNKRNSNCLSIYIYI